MIVGTTPTHTFNLPFEAALLEKVRVTYAQNGTVVCKKETEDCVLEGSSIHVELTQADTLAFNYQYPIRMQLRVLTKAGKALSTKPRTLTAEQCLDGEALE